MVKLGARRIRSHGQRSGAERDGAAVAATLLGDGPDRCAHPVKIERGPTSDADKLVRASESVPRTAEADGSGVDGQITGHGVGRIEDRGGVGVVGVDAAAAADNALESDIFCAGRRALDFDIGTVVVKGAAEGQASGAVQFDTERIIAIACDRQIDRVGAGGIVDHAWVGAAEVEKIK